MARRPPTRRSRPRLARRAWPTIVRRILLAAILVVVGLYIARHLGGLRQLELDLTARKLILAAILGLGWIGAQSLLWIVVLRAVGVATMSWRQAVAPSPICFSKDCRTRPST